MSVVRTRRETLTILGIDPSTTATGVALLCVDGVPEGLLESARTAFWSPAPAEVQCRYGTTLRPKGKFHERIVILMYDLYRLLRDSPLETPALVAVEDPTDFGQPRRRRHAGKVGAALGAVLCAIARVKEEQWIPRPHLRIVPSQQWIPHQATRGRWRHPLKHEDARRLLKMRWPDLADATDDVTFAAGVALYALTGHRLAAS